MPTPVAFITGGASGIGCALGRELARRGVRVIVADRQEARAQEVCAAIRRDGGQAAALALDVRDAEAFRAAARQTMSRYGRVDYVFNNAGIGVGAEMVDFEQRDWDEVFDVNLRGVAHGVAAFYPLLCAQRSGHIINTASVAGLLPAASGGSYTASKHAVVGLSKALRIEARAYGVRVSVLCPGVIRTDILRGGAFGRIKLGPGGVARVQQLWEALRPMEPEALAPRVLRGVERNQAIILVPGWWHLLWWLERASPALSLSLWQRLYERSQRALAPYRLQPDPPVASDGYADRASPGG